MEKYLHMYQRTNSKEVHVLKLFPFSYHFFIMKVINNNYKKSWQRKVITSRVIVYNSVLSELIDYMLNVVKLLCCGKLMVLKNDFANFYIIFRNKKYRNKIIYFALRARKNMILITLLNTFWKAAFIALS